MSLLTAMGVSVSAPRPPTSTNLLLWLKADALTLNNNDPVSAWADSSASGNSATQATGSRQPTYKSTGVNARPAVLFDGTSDVVTNATLSLNASVSIYVVGSTANQVANYQRIIGNENRFFMGRQNTYPPQFASFYGNGAAWGAVTGHGIKAEMGLGVPYCMVSINNAGTVTAYLNGYQVDSRANALTAFVAGGYTVGAAAALNQFWAEYGCEILIYDGAHNDATRQLIESWLKYRWIARVFPIGNAAAPVIVKTGTPNVGWESVDVANPDVFYDAPNSRWVMNYSGNSSSSGNSWATGLAYSTDLLNWTKDPANPVFSPSGGDETGIAANGSIVLKGSTYYLYYHAGFPGKIKVATSPDLHTWTRVGVCIDVGTAGQWDESATFDPAARLMPDGITIEVFYAGKDAASQRGIGRATSIDGTTFTKIGRLFDYTINGRDDNFGEPYPLGNTGATYEFWCDRAIVDGARSISRMATTDSGVTWTFKGNMIIPSGGTGWDSMNVFDSCPVLVGGTLYVFYAGAPNLGNAANMGAQIGVVTTPWP